MKSISKKQSKQEDSGRGDGGAGGRGGLGPPLFAKMKFLEPLLFYFGADLKFYRLSGPPPHSNIRAVTPGREHKFT